MDACPLTISLAVLHAILAPDTHLAATAPGYDADLDALLERIVYVESKGDRFAVNRDEDAIGLDQIRPIYMDDANRLAHQFGLPMGFRQADVLRTRYTRPDRLDPKASRQMVCIVLAHYATGWVQAGNADGWRATPTVASGNGTVPAEVLARIHNGGPEWSRKPATVTYWTKIRTADPEDVAASTVRATPKRP